MTAWQLLFTRALSVFALLPCCFLLVCLSSQAPNVAHQGTSQEWPEYVPSIVQLMSHSHAGCPNHLSPYSLFRLPGCFLPPCLRSQVPLHGPPGRSLGVAGLQPKCCCRCCRCSSPSHIPPPQRPFVCRHGYREGVHLFRARLRVSYTHTHAMCLTGSRVQVKPVARFDSEPVLHRSTCVLGSA